MRIALECSASATPMTSGEPVYIRQLLKGLSRVSDASDRFDLTFKSKRWKDRRLGIDERELDSRFSCRRLWPLPFRPGWARKVDLFHALGPRLPKMRFRREIVTFHDVYALVLEDFWPVDEFPIPETQYRRATRYIEMAQRATLIVCSSQRTQSDLSKVLPEVAHKTRVIPLGADESLTRQVPREEGISVRLTECCSQPFLVHLGVFSAWRNLPRTVNAFGLVVRQFPQARLLLVGTSGKGIVESAVAKAISQHGLENKVLILGEVEDRDKSYLLSRARGLVMFHFHAGFGLPVLEAMALGTPVALSPCGALPEVAGEAALYADPRAPEEMAEVMLTLLQEGDCRSHLIERGKQRVKPFPWLATARTTYQTYQQMLES